MRSCTLSIDDEHSMTTTKKTAGRGRPKKNNRDEVIEAVMQNYWQDGFHSLSLSEVCRRVSVSKPAMYREFGGEDGLMAAVLSHYHELVVRRILSFIEIEQPFVPAMEGLIIAMTTPQDHPPGCLFTEMRILRQYLAEQALARLEAIEEERRLGFERWYARALTQKQVNPAVSPEAASRYIDAQLTLLLLDMKTGKSPADIRTSAFLAMSVLKPQR